jgi:glutamine synthetase
MREVLVFLIALADRIAHGRLAPEARAEFTVALVRHVARTLADNEDELLGAAPAGAPSHGDAFVDLYSDVKAGEHDAYQQVISPWERQHLLLNV